MTDKRTEKHTETHACDLIDRQAAIDAILAVTGNSSVRELYEHVQEHGLSDMWSGGVNAAIDVIIAVPAAQPDLSEYSDKLWRNAYERGKAEARIQKMQDLEQAEIQKAYELGKLDALDELIRCKDCRFYPNHGHKDIVFDADACHWNADEMPDPDDYCSAAERREE